jgi:hypothetical protein
MNSTPLHLARWTALVALPLAQAAGAATIAFDGGCVPQLSPLQQRIVDRAAAGPAELRQFLWIRRAILQPDIAQTMGWADAVESARRRCLSSHADADRAAAPTQASAR